MKTSILRAALFTPMSRGRWGLPLIFWGSPGIGKTDQIRQTAEECGLLCEVLSPGERGEGAFGAIPVPGKDGDGYLHYPEPEWAEPFHTAGRGLVFIDEIADVPPALKPPVNGLLLDRRIGGKILPGGVRTIGAGNPTEESANGYDLAMTTANRTGHMQSGTPSVDEHATYMLSSGAGNGGHVTQTTNPEQEEKRIMANWAEPWARARGLEVAFLQRRPTLKNQMPKPGDPKASRNWPSDRTWEMATRAFAASQVEIHNLAASEREEYVAAFIGEGVASEWFQWIESADLPDPAQLLDGKIQWEHDKKRLDRTSAVMSACAALVTPASADKREARVDAFWLLAGRVAQDGSGLDVLVPPVAAAVQSGLHVARPAARVLAKLQPVLVAAGFRAAGTASF